LVSLVFLVKQWFRCMILFLDRGSPRGYWEKKAMGPLDRTVLVLNRLWQAVNLCSARRAFCLLYQGYAQVVHKEGDGYATYAFWEWLERSTCYEGSDVVRTVSFRVRVPKVILLVFFDKLPSKEVKLTRYNVFQRDNFTCQYCGRRFGKEFLNLDHVIPKERGGQTTWENLVCSCVECNSRKGNRTPKEAGMRLLRRPHKPRWKPLLHTGFPAPVEDAWHRFLDVDSWTVELTQ
jgi:5-methylcytosine-specific restriction endonuclease McrA